MHYAARHGHLESVKWLVENKANLNAKCDGGLTPLQLAQKNGEDEVRGGTVICGFELVE